MPTSPAPGLLLLTGAAGSLGRLLREPLATLCGPAQRYAGLRLSDLGAEAATPGWQRCDLGERAATEQLLQGVAAVVHLGGVALESPFDGICDANIRGVFHLYEAARLAGTRRIVFASSNHVTGCYPQGDMLDPSSPPRPDGFYGVSKLFGEAMAQLYWDRYGIESVCLRLGSVTARPEDRRALATWLSHGDLLRLVRAALQAPAVACLTVYGVSANPGRWWSEAGWAQLGYAPQDSAEPWRATLQDLTPAPDSPMARLQGGSFLGLGPFPREP
ncbi:NAD(P)-dependent oxidoreductase [Paucibacter sediminis]|uniref:NAD(P)-dependent oxidoreductase n=1 Tax=Paucibacter sediminis TaxID=3019553 RepID=A0AA95NDM9_9BURK|nr:NAD(P)-dependent oxidoreductase [Paucibacter sp. S2-9]WIT12204.1 NAD(P)-dependent oxidoreductase [Paucibacter sp. S2-9]